MMQIKIIPDFEGKKEEAKKWADERYKNWQERLLTKAEKEEITDYMNDKEAAQALNKYLEDRRGNIPENSDFRENIERIDKGLKKEKTDQMMYIYQRVHEGYFGHEVNSFRTGMSIKLEKFSEFKEKFITNNGIIRENGYIETSLSGESSNLAKEPCMIIRLKVPAGTHGGYTGSLQEGGQEGTHDFLLDRGYGLQFTDAKIIVQKGKEYIKVEANLLTKAKLEEKITDYSDKLNKELLESNIITIKEHPLVKLNFTGRFLNENFKKSDSIIEAMKSLPIDFLDLVNLRSKYIAEDLGLPNSPNVRIIDEYINGEVNLEGLHVNSGEHESYISLRVAYDPSNTALHEIGHAIDDMLFDHISIKDDFSKLFEQEAQNFEEGWYGRKSSAEFFAECFALYYNSNPIVKERLKTIAPQTYEFIRTLEELLPKIKWTDKLNMKKCSHATIVLNFHDSKCNIYYYNSDSSANIMKI